MHVRVEVGGVRAERLDRDDQARCDVVAIEDRADARDDGVTRRTGEQAEQAPLALEQPAQDARNREHDVAVRHGLEDLRDDVLREQRRALGLAARAEVASSAGEREQVLGPAVRTADPREAALKPAAGEVGLDGCGDDLAQRVFSRLVAFLVLPGVAARSAPRTAARRRCARGGGAGRRPRARRGACLRNRRRQGGKRTRDLKIVLKRDQQNRKPRVSAVSNMSPCAGQNRRGVANARVVR